MSRTLQRRQRLRLPVTLPITLSAHQGHTEGVMTDLSMRGCALKTEIGLDEGSIIRLHVHLPNEQTAITVENAVVRTVCAGRIGVEFLNVTQADQQRLSRFVFQVWKSHNDTCAGMAILRSWQPQC